MPVLLTIPCFSVHFGTSTASWPHQDIRYGPCWVVEREERGMFARAVVPAAALLAGVCANTALAGDAQGELRSGPVLDGDWFGDDVESIGAPSNAGPYEF